MVEAAVVAAAVEGSSGTGDRFARTSVHKATWGIHHQESSALPALIKEYKSVEVLGIGQSQKMGPRAGTQ